MYGNIVESPVRSILFNNVVGFEVVHSFNLNNRCVIDGTKEKIKEATKNKDNEKIIELMEQNVELNQLRTTLAKKIGDRIISPK